MSNHSSSDIASIVKRLYQLAGIRRSWVLANSSLIQDVCILGQTPSYGPRGNIVRQYLGVMKPRFALIFAMRLVALIDVTRWWWRAGVARACIPEQGWRIFVGFGAGPEEMMWQQFNAEDNSPAMHLDQTKPESFGAVHRPGLIGMWKEVWTLSDAILGFLMKVTVEPVASYRKDFITFATIRMGQYVFYFRWWTEMQDRRIEKAIFISPDTPAFACLDSGFEKVEFRQHGLLRKSVLMPPFPSMHLLTEEELNYYSDLLPDSQMEIVQTDKRVTSHRKIILLASVYDWEHFNKSNDMETFIELFKWARQGGFRIIVRRHPRENDDFWSTHFPAAIIDKNNDSFEEALLRLQPMIMMTWFSTTLIDALRCNVVPVSISAADDRHVQDLIVSLPDHCLMWPEQRHVLDSLVAGEVTVDEVVHGLSASRVAREL